MFRTHADAPRVLIANSNLVPRWADWEHFNELDRKGLMMFGQMTAGSWIYIGSQGIVQGTYETFVEMGRQHYGGNLAGRWILTAGLGGMGGAQPLAATMAGASMLAIECQPGAHRQAPADQLPGRGSAAASMRRSRIIERARTRSGKAVSVGLLGNACEVLPELLRRGVRPDAVTDQTSRARSGQRLPAARAGRSSSGTACGARIRSAVARAARDVDGAGTSRRCLPSSAQGIPVFDYGNNIRQVALDDGCQGCLRLPGLRARLHPAAVLPRHRARFAGSRCRATPRTSTRTDAKVRELLPHDTHLHHWLDMARERIQFQGLPARICWVGLGDRHRLGLAFNEMVARGELKAPIVIGRDHLDSGSVASPNRETEAMQRRLGCGLRLAAAERAAEYRKRRHLGVDPPRRRRRHGLLAARRRGHRVRRHAGGRAPHRAGAVERSGHRASCATPMPATTIAIECAREQGLNLPFLGAAR